MSECIDKVSIIIPFYNNVHWLEEAVKSALSQTYTNTEIIIVNDGSKECISDFLIKYRQQIIYREQKNRGAASARNLALKLASGSYIAFLDSDDIWLPEKLEKQVTFMKNTGALWSHTGYYYWTPNTGKLREANLRNEYGDIYKKTFVSIRIATPCVILKSSLLKSHPHLIFNESYKIGQDTKLWQEISRLYPIGLLREPLTMVRLRSNNTHKQYLRLIHHRAAEFRANLKTPNTFLVANIIGIYYLSSSKIFPSQSNNKILNTLAKFSMIPPYILGRLYINSLNLINLKYHHLVE